MSLEAWGDEPWDDGPELPEGWWDEDTVNDVQTAIKDLCAETVYENGKKEDGISVRFLARLTLLRYAALMMKSEDMPLVYDAERELNIHSA